MDGREGSVGCIWCGGRGRLADHPCPRCVDNPGAEPAPAQVAAALGDDPVLRSIARVVGLSTCCAAPAERAMVLYGGDAHYYPACSACGRAQPPEGPEIEVLSVREDTPGGVARPDLVDRVQEALDPGEVLDGLPEPEPWPESEPWETADGFEADGRD